jgi:branched-chain amino acid transport system ATP-binding protein
MRQQCAAVQHGHGRPGRLAEPLLAVDGLEVRYGPVAAVRDVDLSVGQGEIVGVIGPNGAGKSTTLRTIIGLLRPHRGEIRLHGTPLHRRSPEAVARAGIALVPEGRQIYADFTVEENLRLGLIARRSRDGLGRDLEWLREIFPVLREFRHRKAGLLSGGQQQQLAIARAVVAAPDLLLLDEPSLGLAPQVVEAVFDALLRIRERGVGILLVEQRAQRTVALADRTHVLTNGAVRMTLTPADASDTERMIAAYLA